MKWLNKHITTDDFWYDLFDGGYIRPEELLQDRKDVNEVKNAIDLLLEFRREAESNGIIDSV